MGNSQGNKQEAQVYATKIEGFYKKRGRMPTYQEVAELLGFASKNAAYKVVNRFIETGLVARDIKGKLVPGKRFAALIDENREIRKLGLVEAGFPSPAEEELADTMSLDEFLIRNRDATYVLTVKGDSMEGAGIIEGDMVLVERVEPSKVKSGDIVIAEVDGEFTMKYFRKQGSRVYLEAANPKYKPIVPTQEMKVAAVVKAVIRRY